MQMQQLRAIIRVTTDCTDIVSRVSNLKLVLRAKNSFDLRIIRLRGFTFPSRTVPSGVAWHRINTGKEQSHNSGTTV
jgi:hypothetical protein